MMATITYRRGDARPLVFAPRDDTGALATGTLELRIAAEGTCLIVACTPTADGYAADLTALDTLSPRARRASLWLRRTGGWEHLGDLTLIITGGC